MKSLGVTSDRETIERVAYAIWESEGQPEGRDHDHWVRAKQLVAEGRAEAEFPQAFAAPEGDPAAPTRGPGAHALLVGRPAPDNSLAERDVEGLRNPAPIPPTDEDGIAAIPSSEDDAAGALDDTPKPPSR